MARPTIERIHKDGAYLWLVQYGGMARYFADSMDWSAKQFFEHVTLAYAVEASSQASRSAM